MKRRRVVKKTKIVAPPMFTSWNFLPNEIKASIVQKMDLKTRVVFRNCGLNESELVRRFGKQVVNIRVTFTKSEKDEAEKMLIEMEDAGTKVAQLRWFISKQSRSGSIKVIYPSFKHRVLIIKSETIGSTTSTILRRILTEPMFVVKKLELQLRKFDQKIDLSSKIASIECLILNWCENPNSLSSILGNKNLKFKGIVGYTCPDRRFLYNFESSVYGGPRSFLAGPLYDQKMSEYCSYLFQFELESHWKSHQSFKKFWELTLGQYDFEDEHYVHNKLKLPKTTDDIMSFREAYYYKSRSVPYLQYEKEYKDKVAFLREGIDEYLSDYQLTILSIAYLARLFRNEPAIRKIHDIAFEDL